MKIETNKGQSADFWIARVGSKAGKPLRSPYTSHNSFAVVNAKEGDFARMLAAYEGGAYYPVGTCQPAIRINDVRKVAIEVESMALDKCKQIEAAYKAIKEQQRIYQQMEKKVRKLAAAYYHHHKLKT